MNNHVQLIRPDWPAPPNVYAVFSTRLGGVSTGRYTGLNLGRASGDDAACVERNQQLLVQAAGLPMRPNWIAQVHGRAVVRMPHAGIAPEADAAWTDAANQVVAVQAADCLPVLFCDDEGRTVAAAHAGWRGLAAGVLEATVAALPVSPCRLLAWLGPAIGPEAFEVGAEVRAAFVAVDPAAAGAFVESARPGHFFADLFALAWQRLARAGVGRVFGGGVSTFADPERFYSFRRDGATGRMAALIWRATVTTGDED